MSLRKVAPTRRDHLREYLRAVMRESFSSKAELASLAGLERLRQRLSEDLREALSDLGLSPAATQTLAAEAIGAALAKKAAGWLFGK